jgi:DNA-binding CsgD family transcriptional regulator
MALPTVPPSPFDNNPARKLTQRERECLELVEKQLESKEISRALGISFHTVNQHLQKAKETLQAKDRFEAARIYRRLLAQGLWDGPALSDTALGIPNGDSNAVANENFHLGNNPFGMSPHAEVGSDQREKTGGGHGQFRHADRQSWDERPGSTPVADLQLGDGRGRAPGNGLRIARQDDLRPRLPASSSETGDVPAGRRGYADDLWPGDDRRIRGLPTLGPTNTLTVIERLMFMTAGLVVGLVVLGLCAFILNALKA